MSRNEERVKQVLEELMVTYFTNLLVQQVEPIGAIVLILGVIGLGARFIGAGPKGIGEALLSLVGVVVGAFMILFPSQFIAVLRAAAGAV